MNTYLIRKENINDCPGIHQMHCFAFGGEAEAKLTDDLRKSGDAVISLVALKDETIIGHIMLSRLKAPMKALTLAPIAVHPDFQRQGVGSALLRKGLDHAKQDGWKAVFVLGDTGFYERAGFTVSEARGFSSPYAGEHFMALSFDPENTPKTGELTYPLPFSTLK